MLAWLGIAATAVNHGFWSFENLFASAFRRHTAMAHGFEFATLSGAALWLLLYSGLGAAFAALVRDRLQPVRSGLFAILFSLAWFYLSFHWLWRHAMPLLYLFYPERPVLMGHVLYGICLARQRTYLPQEEEPEVTPALLQSASPLDRAMQSGSSEPAPREEAP